MLFRSNRMLANLRQRQTEGDDEDFVDLDELLQEAIRRKSELRPQPVLTRSLTGVCVRASRDRLLSVVEHLLQNAIEATDAAGRVEVTVTASATEVRTSIADSGCGMDHEFINNRLFKPFDTTKGKIGRAHV